MPLPISLAHRLARSLGRGAHNGLLAYLPARWQNPVSVVARERSTGWPSDTLADSPPRHTARDPIGIQLMKAGLQRRIADEPRAEQSSGPPRPILLIQPDRGSPFSGQPDRASSWWGGPGRMRGGPP